MSEAAGTWTPPAPHVAFRVVVGFANQDQLDDFIVEHVDSVCLDMSRNVNVLSVERVAEDRPY